MKKNVASQRVGAQMVSATDGSAFTGAVTVAVTGDAGTQATGSVGAGACTHEGNGYHTYAPAQAETNYDLVAFTFTGSGAVPVTVSIYTSFPQTGDSYARIGAPAGASVSADVAAMKVDTAAILVDTGTTLDGKIDAIDDYVDSEVAAIKAVTDALGATAAGRLSTAVLAEQTGTIDTAGFSPTTTEFEADDITEATADHYNGRVIIFTSGALQYQATSITDYALSGGRGHFTCPSLTEAPANNDTFIIV